MSADLPDPAAVNGPMRLPPVQPLLPTRADQGRALLIVLAVMATLAALALLFSRGADRLDARWSAQLSETSTVQVLVPSEALRAPQMAEVEAILREDAPGAEVTPLTREDALALIQPWVGDTALPDDLPVPGVIRVSSSATLPEPSLQSRFEAANIRAVIDDHSRFSGNLKRTVGRLVALGAALVMLTLVATTAVSIFATRAGLAAQRDIIHVLVQAGASDGFIARLFVMQSARNGAIGGAIGAGLAALVWAFVSAGPGRGSVGWSGFGVALGDLILLAVLVGLFAFLGAMAAGWTATRQLSDERRRA